MSLHDFFRKHLLFTALLLTFPGVLPAGTIPVDSWLVVTGPGSPLPAFADTENIKGEPYTTKNLFRFNPLDLSNHYPSENKAFPGGNDFNSFWSPAMTNDEGSAVIEKSQAGASGAAYLATYISVGRWMEAGLEIYSRQKFEVFLNGKPLGSKTTTQEKEEEPGKWNQEVELAAGKHRLIVRTFHSCTDKSPWQIGAGLVIPGWAEDSDTKVELDPLQGKNINHLLDGIKAGPATLSSDAALYAANFSRTLPPSDRSENWLEIKRVSDGKLVHSFRHMSIKNFAWAPEANKFSYITERDGKSTIWIHDMIKGSYFALLEDIEDFGSYNWSPDGSFMIYSVSEKNPDKEGDLQRILGMRDRLPGYRTRHFLYRVDINTGWKQRLTHGFLTTSLHDISPDSKRILFSQSRPDYLERPYSKQDVFIMDLESMALDTIFKDMRWGVSGQFSPDGKRLLLTGGPSAFGETGENIPEGMIANNYDTQAYLYDLAGRDVDPITKEFNPSVSQAIWNKNDNSIYLVAGDEDLMHLFRYNSKNRRFTRVDTGEDVLNRVNMAENAPFAVISGSGMSSPPKVSLLELRTGRYRELENPDRENFKNVVFGETREWDFNNTQGVRIPGRVYLPPDFDESGKYPLIVYYYGGTNPVSRSFGGRYPFNMYAANGYVVYVLQPSGATGFGQEFSAHHVNNWGLTVADEIIMGTKLFLEGHAFIDAGRIGCMGASYGGFMTKLLQTRTDIFAAAISHAGISSISSYWGEGYWGYGYSAEASAGSYPWNNRELYVEQSPLFSADKITTPLLLLHGSDDTNVPPGESIQLYTALKLLGRPVELVKIAGEDHHILTYSKRIGWSNTILSWFDKWLKDQPQWWDHMYPDRNY
jgi:dipeptidyl aminopeptidase/acylaminoacyl peptidase